MQSLNYGLRIGMPKGQQIDEIVPDLVTQSGKSFRKLKSKVEKPEIKRIKQSQFDLKIKFYEFSQQALISACEKTTNRLSFRYLLLITCLNLLVFLVVCFEYNTDIHTVNYFRFAYSRRLF